MNKKISILIYSLASGGAERVVSILLNEFKDKYDVTLVLMSDEIHYSIPKDIKLYFLEKSNPSESGIIKLIKLPFLGWRYKKICKKNNISVSLSFMNRPNYINIFAKIFGSKVKTIISERAMPSLQHQYGIQGKINRFLITYLYGFSDKVIANSLGNSSDLKNSFNIHNIITINNPLNLEKIEKNVRENIEFNRDKFTFITVGRLDSGKNHKLMINAMKVMNAYLYIIGEGHLYDDLKNQIKELNLEEQVFLLGKQDNPYKFLSKSDCFIFTSNYEGFPNVVVEALACELPIISTDCKSGPREILAPNTDFHFQLNESGFELGEYGILTSLNNEKSLVSAMELILKNESLRNKYKKKAKLRANDFSIIKITTKFLNVIERN